MDKATFSLFEEHMKKHAGDVAHDREHVYRVLYMALDIAAHEENVDQDILIAACLLHDIGREAQYKDPSLCHAQEGARMAYDFCVAHGVKEARAARIRSCVSSHRFRGDNPPESIEAKILYDADKLDAAGTMGIARTLLYKGIANEPLYCLDERGLPITGRGEGRFAYGSFLYEYHYKLKKVYRQFHTARAAKIAKERKRAAKAFVKSFKKELSQAYDGGRERLRDVLETKE